MEEGGLEMAAKALILLPLGSGVQSLSSGIWLAHDNVGRQTRAELTLGQV